MSKARELSSLTSDGSPLADGAINASEVSGLSTVATSGSYNDLSNIPAPFDPATLATVATTGAYSDLTGTPALATVATTGAYSSLSGAPALASVATTGAYSSLSGLPTIPTHTSQLTNNSGYITSVPAPSAAQVGSATAGLSVGAVGTYALMIPTNQSINTQYNWAPGHTLAGSSLAYLGASESNTGGWNGNYTYGTGTWRLMSRMNYYVTSGGTVWDRRVTLWLRIS